jgi:hypothetical protein
MLPALDADDGQTELTQVVIENRGHPPRLEYGVTAICRFWQLAGDRLCRRRRLALMSENTPAVDAGTPFAKSPETSR